MCYACRVRILWISDAVFYMHLIFCLIRRPACISAPREDTQILIITLQVNDMEQ